MITTLPLVLPPSVLGFYLLVTFSDSSFLGIFLKDYFNIELLFSFSGLILASCIYSLPFMVQPIQNGFESLNKYMLEASYIGGKSKIKTILFVAIPNIKSSITTAIIITFAHTIGEFGVILIIGGSIPNETKVASIAIYEEIEMLNYSTANIYSFIMLVFSFIILFFLSFLKSKSKRNMSKY